MLWCPGMGDEYPATRSIKCPKCGQRAWLAKPGMYVCANGHTTYRPTSHDG